MYRLLACTSILCVIASVVSIVYIATPKNAASSWKPAYTYDTATDTVILPRLNIARSRALFDPAHPATVSTPPPLYIAIPAIHVYTDTCSSLQRRNIICMQPFGTVAMAYLAVAVPYTIVASQQYSTAPPRGMCITTPHCPGIRVYTATCRRSFRSPISALYQTNTSVYCTASHNKIFDIILNCSMLLQCPPLPASNTIAPTTTTTSDSTATTTPDSTTTGTHTTSTTTTTTTTSGVVNGDAVVVLELRLSTYCGEYTPQPPTYVHFWSIPSTASYTIYWKHTSVYIIAVVEYGNMVRMFYLDTYNELGIYRVGGAQSCMSIPVVSSQPVVVTVSSIFPTTEWVQPITDVNIGQTPPSTTTRPTQTPPTTPNWMEAFESWGTD
jgi:hypothetical protein